MSEKRNCRHYLILILSNSKRLRNIALAVVCFQCLSKSTHWRTKLRDADKTPLAPVWLHGRSINECSNNPTLITENALFIHNSTISRAISVQTLQSVEELKCSAWTPPFQYLKMQSLPQTSEMNWRCQPLYDESLTATELSQRNCWAGNLTSPWPLTLVKIRMLLEFTSKCNRKH